MIDRAILYEVYKREQNYKKTASYFGVSRQRIEALLRNSTDPEVIAVRASKHPTEYTCETCERLYRRTAFKDNGNCFACRTYLKMHPSGKGKGFRVLTYPKNCSKCGVEMIAKSRTMGKCRKCYMYDMARTPARRANLRLYVANHRERIRATARRRYHEKKERNYTIYTVVKNIAY